MTTAATLGTRFLQAVLSLVTVPLALHHFGQERYGLWLTLSSLLSVLVFVDQGMGFGLVQVVARARGVDDRRAVAEYSTAAVVTMAGIGLLVMAATLGVFPIVHWGEVFNVSSAQAVREAGVSTLVLAAGFAVAAVGGVGPRIHQGFQEGFVANAWQLVGSVIAFGSVLVIVRTDASLSWLVAAMVLGPGVGAFAGTLALFGHIRPWLRPSVTLLSAKRFRELVGVSGSFLVTQLSMAAAFAVDNFLVARVLGAAAVPDYAVPARLFYFAQTLVVLVPQALWPAYGEAIAGGDREWAVRAFRRATVLTIAAAVSVALMLALGGLIAIKLWVGEAVQVHRSLLIAMGVGFVAQCAAANVTTFLSGLQALRAQMILSLGLAATAIPLKYYALELAGPWGIPVASALSVSAVVLVPGVLVVRSLLRRTTSQTPSGAERTADDTGNSEGREGI